MFASPLDRDVDAAPPRSGGKQPDCLHSCAATNAEPERGSWLNRMTRAGSREGSPDHSADRGSWMQRMTRAGSREASPDHATDRGSWMRRMTGTGSAEGSPIQSIGPGSWIHRLTSHETSDHAHHEPYIGRSGAHGNPNTSSLCSICMARKRS